MSFINKYTFKCLLGPRSSDVNTINDIHFWTVYKKKHFCTSKILTSEDVEILREYGPASFHYLSADNLSFLKNNFKVSQSKDNSIILDIQDLSFKGGQFKKLRQSLTRCGKNEFEILDNFKDINDVVKMIKEWSNKYTDKYFRDFSGKNTYFYKNNFHLNC